MSDDLRQQYASLTAEAGFVVLRDRCFVRLTGRDRQAFFHNFCTNEIKGLMPDQVCEAFVLNSRGKILGYVHAFATSEELLLTGHGDQAGTLITHLDQYLIREDVELADATQELAAVFICGDQARERLSETGVTLPRENHVCETRMGDAQIRIAHVELAGPGYLVVSRQSELEHVLSTLANSDLVACSIERVEHRAGGTENTLVWNRR